MLIDGLLVFSSAQALTSTGTVASTNVIDLSTARDASVGGPPMLLHTRVNTTFTSGGAGTLQVLAQGSTDNSTFYTMAESIAYALAALVSGADLLNISLPGPGAGQANPRYVRLAYVIATAAFTAGTVDGMLVLDRPRNRPYPAGINISN